MHVVGRARPRAKAAPEPAPVADVGHPPPPVPGAKAAAAVPQAKTQGSRPRANVAPQPAPVADVEPPPPPPVEPVGRARPKPRAAPRDDLEGRGFVPAAMGGTICCQYYVEATPNRLGVHVEYTNYILRFRAHGRQWERKHRITPQNQRTYGVIEPIAYVHAMMKEIIDGNPDFLNNPRQKPTPEMVAAMAEENRCVPRDLHRHMGRQTVDAESPPGACGCHRVSDSCRVIFRVLQSDCQPWAQHLNSREITAE